MTCDTVSNPFLKRFDMNHGTELLYQPMAKPNWVTSFTVSKLTMQQLRAVYL